MQEMRVQSLIREDPTCHEATKPVRHSYRARALQPGSHNYWAHRPQLPKPACLRVHALQQEKPLQGEAWASQLERSRSSPQLEKSLQSNEDPAQPKK